MATAFNFIVVFLGAGLGGALRHGVNGLAGRWFGTLPWGTLVINVSGSLAIGLVAGYYAFRGEAVYATRLFLVTGVLGGFTTFSAFSLETLLLIESRQTVVAVGYVVASVILAVGAVWTGLALSRP